MTEPKFYALDASLDVEISGLHVAEAGMTQGSTSAVPFVAARGISKSFGALKALRDVDLDIYRGEVLALLGDNGAGKSTFVKVLSGAHPASDGKLTVNGKEVSFGSPKEAADHGIATIYQELALAGNLTVTENVFLGHELTHDVLGIPFSRRREMRSQVRELLKRLSAHIDDPDARVEGLSGGQRQAVAISRALNLDAKLVIMDEPTAALAVAETQKVLDLARNLAEQGCAVVIISHNIADVFSVADRMVVFRRGHKIAERRREETDPDEIVSLITGAHPDARAIDQALK